MRRAFALGEDDPEFCVGDPVVAADRASVEWWGVVALNGEPHTFAGTAWLRFDENGLVIEEHDYWHAAPGRIEPWPWWGASSRR
jgi:hypothetical protein